MFDLIISTKSGLPYKITFLKIPGIGTSVPGRGRVSLIAYQKYPGRYKGHRWRKGSHRPLLPELLHLGARTHLYAPVKPRG